LAQVPQRTRGTLGVDGGLELKAVQVTPVALERVVDRRMFRPTLGTRTSCPRGEGAVEIDPARLGIEGHVNDLPGSREAGRKGKQRQRGHDESRRRLAWRRVRAYRRKEGHRVGLKRATLRDGKHGATHTKRKRARKIAVYQVLRRHHRENLRLFDQQLLPAGIDHRGSLPLPLTRGAVFQMDQATPAHRGVLRHLQRMRSKAKSGSPCRPTYSWLSPENG